MSKLPTCKGKEAVKAFKKNGWVLARYIDDHFILKKQGERYLLSIPDHNPIKKVGKGKDTYYTFVTE